MGRKSDGLLFGIFQEVFSWNFSPSRYCSIYCLFVVFMCYLFITNLVLVYDIWLVMNSSFLFSGVLPYVGYVSYEVHGKKWHVAGSS